MNAILKEIQDCVEKFIEEHKKNPKSVTFQKPKWNELLTLSSQDILNAGIASDDEIEEFNKLVGEKGPTEFSGKKVYGLEIRFANFGKENIIIK